ncbi:hypothetical protein OROHE_002004 [Orobanche hederae]
MKYARGSVIFSFGEILLFQASIRRKTTGEGLSGFLVSNQGFLMNLQEICNLDSPQSNNDDEHITLRNSHISGSNIDPSFFMHSQSNVSQTNSFPHSNHFNSSQFQFQPYYGVNRITAPFTHYTSQQYRPDISFQGLLSEPIVSCDTHTISASKKLKKKHTPNDSTDSQQIMSANSNIRWTTAEDIALTRAFLYVSVDAIIGKEQANHTMWDRILVVWKDNILADDKTRGKIPTYDLTRGGNSLQCHWKVIQAAVNKFHGLYESLERAPQSGASILDMKREAHRMYRETTRDGAPFKYEHCWEIMKENPKWCSQQLTKSGSSKKVKTNDGCSAQVPINDIDYIDIDNPAATQNINVEGLERAEGRKASKEKKKKMGEQKGVIEVLSNIQSTMEKQYIFNQRMMDLKEQAIKKAIELKERAQQSKEEAQRRKVNVLKQREQERIMNLNLNSFQPAMRSVYEKMHAKIIEDWKAEGLLGDVSTSNNTEI